MVRAVNHNRTTYMKHGCRCDVCCAANEEFNEKRRQTRAKNRQVRTRLDGVVFVDRLTRDGRLEGLSANSVRRWMREGIELYNADEWCVRLGYHPVEIWGQRFYEGCFDYV